MMPVGGVLSDSAILQAIKAGDIVIEPFDQKNLGGNSYDIHLGPVLAEYQMNDHYEQTDFRGDFGLIGGPGYKVRRQFIDSAKEAAITHVPIPETGFILEPGRFYLGATLEYTATDKYLPWLDGKSSTGRLGIKIHATAGRGDVGFKNHWTLEIEAAMPVKVYAGMPIGQITYFTVVGEVMNPYDKKPSAKYARERNGYPVASSMWKNFPLK